MLPLNLFFQNNCDSMKKKLRIPLTTIKILKTGAQNLQKKVMFIKTVFFHLFIKIFENKIIIFIFWGFGEKKNMFKIIKRFYIFQRQQLVVKRRKKNGYLFFSSFTSFKYFNKASLAAWSLVIKK